MKKVILCCGMLLSFLLPLFGEVGASAYMTGEVWGTNGFLLNNQEQKDDDSLTVWVNGKRAGMYFRVWAYPLENNKDNLLRLRSIKVWFKPIDVVTVSVGNVGSYLYTEQLDWWQTPAGASYAQYQAWDTRWSNYAGYEGGGVGVELSPMENLYLAFGITPGFGTRFMQEGELISNDLRYGAVVKYSFPGIGSVGASFRDDGFGEGTSEIPHEQKIAKFGFDVSAIEGMYGFLQFVFRFDTSASAWGTSDDPLALQGISLDPYFSYSFEDFSLQAHIPLTFRLTGGSDDPSYMTFDVKVSYALSTYIPYVRIQQQGDVPLLFNEDFAFEPQYNIGVEWGFDANSWFDVSLQIENVEGKISWCIPFSARAGF
ncbi:hypothetical protein Spith_0364 [Spirochaeta thermophila DSM 6578]|uniref:Uncharacterized protein n=1 Tax=Winmispira thermophila (strain ATCC 700085 / DSM 6578 / Z-1203) TaxID=869211 RepID=G0GE17_WINT7|nr:hypothetical protein [Spirochaeta thermophila]AEJ60649.1 hypothetical protein Spith_0364 [Spirochaeta thermophila DSM 6578]